MGSSTPNKVRVRFIILDGARAAWPVFCFLRVTEHVCRLPASTCRLLLVGCLLVACCLLPIACSPVVYAAGNTCRVPSAYWAPLPHCWVRRMPVVSPHQHARYLSAATHNPRVFPFIGISIVKKTVPLPPLRPHPKTNSQVAPHCHQKPPQKRHFRPVAPGYRKPPKQSNLVSISSPPKNSPSALLCRIPHNKNGNHT